jgi:N-acetylneuraminate synthase
LAQRLIDAAAAAGCHAVKFQKRTVDVVYSRDELSRPRESPFGTTNGDLKRGLEFGRAEYEAIDRACRKAGVLWFASCWDEGSVDFIEAFDPPCYKIASPCLTDYALLRRHRRTGKPLLVSTGMSTLEQIDAAVRQLDAAPLVLMHCTSSYPAPAEELNLRMIPELHSRYDVPVGYSGHEVGLSTTVAAVALGACVVERHLTLDRAMWGSDHAASVEPEGFARLAKYVRAVERALGDGVKRVYDSEVAAMRKLRRAGPA